MTGGIGPERCIDAVGMESHGLTLDNILDHVKATIGIGDRPRACIARRSILAVPQGRRAFRSPASMAAFADKFPLGAMMEKGLQIKTGQTHVQKYMPEAARADRSRARSTRPS